MLIVQSRNESELATILASMEGTVVVRRCADAPTPVATPDIISGTCSACPHFESRRTDFDRGGYVKWGTCHKLGANVNEHKEQCSAYKNEGKEVKVEERETRRIYVA